MRAQNLRTGAVLARVRAARTLRDRAVGLLGRREPLGPDEGLWIVPCRSVHTLGMRIPIAAVHLDRQGRVLRVVAMPPWRLGSLLPGTLSVLEVAPDVGGLFAAGDVVAFEEEEGEG